MGCPFWLAHHNRIALPRGVRPSSTARLRQGQGRPGPRGHFVVGGRRRPRSWASPLFPGCLRGPPVDDRPKTLQGSGRPKNFPSRIRSRGLRKVPQFLANCRVGFFPLHKARRTACLSANSTRHARSSRRSCNKSSACKAYGSKKTTFLFSLTTGFSPADYTRSQTPDKANIVQRDFEKLRQIARVFLCVLSPRSL